MESRYGGGNNQQYSPRIPQSSNYSYFAEQARAAGYRGPEIRRAPHEFFTDYHHHHHHPHPLTHPQLRPPPPHPHAMHDAILREIEKEKIREEIIISEIARRRVLEAEVRRELMIERELALQRGGDGFQFGSGPQIRFDPPMRLAITGPRFEGRSLDERMGMSQEETRRNGVRENGGFETLPFQNPGVGVRISEIKPVSEGGKEKVILLAKPRENVSGSKRKASTPPGADATEIPLDEILKKKAKEEWSCAICKVNATSDRGLNEHLQGKRHKSKEKALKAQRSEKNYSIGLLPKKATKSIKAEETIDPGAEEGVKCTGEALVSQKKNESKLVKRVETKDDQKKKKYNFWCEMCKVGTLTLKTMNIHKKGKKHARRVERSNRKDGSHSKKIDVLVNHVKCDDVEDDEPVGVVEPENHEDKMKEDPTDVDKMKEDRMAGDGLKEDRMAGDGMKEENELTADETSDETRVEDDEPVNVVELENHEDEMKEDPTAVDEVKEDPTAVDEIKEDHADVDKLKEDHMARDEMRKDRTAVDELKEDAVDEITEDSTAVDEITEDSTAVDEMKEDRTAGDEMKQDDTAGDEITEDRTAGDEMKEDRTTGDEMKEDRTTGDEMKEDRTAEDEMKENRTAVDIAKPEDELTVDVAESK